MCVRCLLYNIILMPAIVKQQSKKQQQTKAKRCFLVNETAIEKSELNEALKRNTRATCVHVEHHCCISLC